MGWPGKAASWGSVFRARGRYEDFEAESSVFMEQKGGQLTPLFACRREPQSPWILHFSRGSVVSQNLYICGRHSYGHWGASFSTPRPRCKDFRSEHRVPWDFEIVLLSFTPTPTTQMGKWDLLEFPGWCGLWTDSFLPCSFHDLLLLFYQFLSSGFNLYFCHVVCPLGASFSEANCLTVKMVH